MRWFVNILKNLFSKPATRKYPFEPYHPIKDTRGRPVFNVKNCVFCGSCARVCPVGAIEIDRENKTLIYDPYQCIFCGECAKKCFPKKKENERGVKMAGHYPAPSREKKKEIYV